jgi:hypothetical protein
MRTIPNSEAKGLWLVEQSHRCRDCEAAFAIHNQAQLTPSAEIAQGVKDLSQGQLRSEFGHLLNASTGSQGYHVKDVVNDGVIRFHAVANPFTIRGRFNCSNIQ